jgi:hypothetical protein
LTASRRRNLFINILAQRPENFRGVVRIMEDDAGRRN